jgi:catechol 2,3-dioxygenase-like lactoylglutathione lyase family enzyme
MRIHLLRRLAVVRRSPRTALIALTGLGAPLAPLLAQGPVPGPPAALTPYLVALSVANVDSAYAWYRQMLGFEEMRPPYAPIPGLRIAFLIRSDFRLELIEAAHSRPRRAALPDSTRDISLQGFTKLAFRVPDVDATAAMFRARGVPLVFGPASDSAFRERHFIVADPDGNLLQFFQPFGP